VVALPSARWCTHCKSCTTNPQSLAPSNLMPWISCKVHHYITVALSSFSYQVRNTKQYRAAFKDSPGNTGCGYVLMIDEIKVEERLRWDPSTNRILGLCQEHTEHVSLDFCLMSDAKALVHGILRGEIHHATVQLIMSCLLTSMLSYTYRQQFFLLESFQRTGMCGARGPSSSAEPVNGRVLTDMHNLYLQ
jgi:hypothetical protein